MGDSVPTRRAVIGKIEQPERQRMQETLLVARKALSVPLEGDQTHREF